MTVTLITFLEVLLTSSVPEAVRDRTDCLLDAGSATIANGIAPLVPCISCWPWLITTWMVVRKDTMKGTVPHGLWFKYTSHDNCVYFMITPKESKNKGHLRRMGDGRHG